jgi:CheY-like chemotaxis protein
VVVVDERLIESLSSPPPPTPSPPFVALCSLQARQRVRASVGPGLPFAAMVTMPARRETLQNALERAVARPQWELVTPLPDRADTGASLRLLSPTALLDATGFQSQLSPPSGGRASFDMPRPRVLAADDSAVNRSVLRLLLQRLNADMTLVADGAAAVEAATAPDAMFDIVLLDRHMPRLDGGSAARAIRAHALAHWPRVPAILGVSGDPAWGQPCEAAGTAASPGHDSSDADELHAALVPDPDAEALDAFLIKPVLLPALQLAMHRCRPDLVPPPPTRRMSGELSPFEPLSPAVDRVRTTPETPQVTAVGCAK